MFSALLTLALGITPAAPPELGTARTVAFGYDLGDSFVGEAYAGAIQDVTSKDREALAEVRRLFEGWGRYEVVDRPAHADLLVGVRTGRLVVLNLGGPIAGGGRDGVRVESVRTLGIEVSTPDDLLSVYEGAGGYPELVKRPGRLLWRVQHPRGMPAPQVFAALFGKLRSAVEKASRRP
jgi:hypothetical protein